MGWEYPVFNVLTGEPYLHEDGKQVLRWKNFDKVAQGGPKYAWRYGQGACPPFYGASDLGDAVGSANGILYLVNGEPAVLAMHAAGYRNALSGLNGEGTISPELLVLLQALGVGRVIYPFDKDEAGRASGERLGDRLRGTGIAFEAVRLPDSLPAKADVNDLWIALGFDRNVFRRELESLPQVIEQPPDGGPRIMTAVKPTALTNAKQTHHWEQQVDWDAERAKWWNEVVMPHLDSVAPIVLRNRYEYRHCPNPAHPDRNPSFRISYDKSDTGIPMCSCNIQNEKGCHDIVAQWVDAPPFREWWKSERRPILSHGAKHRFVRQSPKQLLRPLHADSNGGDNKTPAIAEAASAPEPGFEYTELGNAKRLVKRHGVNIRYDYRRKKWFVWNDKHWIDDQGIRIEQLAKETVEAIRGEWHVGMSSAEAQNLIAHSRRSQQKARCTVPE